MNASPCRCRRGGVSFAAVTLALHIIDETTPPDAMDQLSLLSAPSDDRIVAIGEPQAGAMLALRPQRVHCPLGVSRLAGRRLRRASADADIVHAWSPRSGEAAVACSGHRPAVLSLSALPAGATLKRLIRRLRKGQLVCSVPASVTRERLISAGAPARSVTVIPPAAEMIDNAGQRRARAREAMGLNENTTLLVAPAPLVRNGGARAATWIHGICRHAGCAVHLAIPRTGPFEPHVRYFATTAGVPEETHFTAGKLDIADVLAAGDIALVCAKTDIGCSAAVAAMAAGLCVVATNLPQLAECVGHNRTGLLCPPGDVRSAAAAVLQLIEEPDLAERLSQAALTAARENHDVGRCRGLLSELYQAALDAAPA